MDMNDYLSIQEFASLSGIEASTLRYWDEIGLFSPIRRNPDNNYRYYSMVQVLTLNFVTVLSDLAFPLRTIADLRNERDPEKLLFLLEKQEKQMDMEMRSLRLRYSIIHARRELINFGMKVDESQISILYQEETEMSLWPKNEYNEDDTFVEPLAAFIAKSGDYHINLSFPVGGYHESMESYLNAPGRPDHFYTIDPVGTHSRKAGNYLVGFTRGYYADMGDLPERMAAYASENGLVTSGPVYTYYLHDEICMKDHTKYLAQSCIAVDKGA